MNGRNATSDFSGRWTWATFIDLWCAISNRLTGTFLFSNFWRARRGARITVDYSTYLQSASVGTNVSERNNVANLAFNTIENFNTDCLSKIVSESAKRKSHILPTAQCWFWNFLLFAVEVQIETRSIPQNLSWQTWVRNFGYVRFAYTVNVRELIS